MKKVSGTPEPDQNEYVNLKKACTLFVTRPTMRRLKYWINEGVHSKKNRDTRIRLRCVREGGDIFTTAAWVNEFRDALTLDAIRG